MAKILVADDEPDVCQLIKRYAEAMGHQVVCVPDGRKAVALCREQAFDVVVMDVMMPDMDGFAASEAIRQEQDIPILMLSACGAEYDKLRGFELGIDDYVVKPFSPRELMARIQVIVRRHQAEQAALVKQPDGMHEAVWTGSSGGLHIDVPGRTVTVDGVRTELTAKEFDLLVYFVKNKGIALSRSQILNAVWGYEYYGDDRTVDWQVKLLRGKLGAYRDWIVTLRGVGYRFEAKN